MSELKRLHKDAIPAALMKAERYRLLNEPGEAESICLDILHIEPSNQEALVSLVLALSDQFREETASSRTAASRADEFLSRRSRPPLAQRRRGAALECVRPPAPAPSCAAANGSGRASTERIVGLSKT